MKGYPTMLLTVFAAVFCLSGACLTKSADKQGGESSSTAAAEDSQAADIRVAGTPAVIQGMVRIYGSEPHTFVGITADGKKYAV